MPWGEGSKYVPDHTVDATFVDFKLLDPIEKGIDLGMTLHKETNMWACFVLRAQIRLQTHIDM